MHVRALQERWAEVAWKVASKIAARVAPDVAHKAAPDAEFGAHETCARKEGIMDLRSLQKPVKEQYRADPNASRITIHAKGAQTGAPIACSVDLGRAIHQAEAHKGVGGPGAGACSGDLLLGALAACAQITCQMVSAAMSIPTERIEVTVEGDLDLRGTLGISKQVPVGFENIRVNFDIAAPGATAEQITALREKTEQYCVVMQTLLHPPPPQTTWTRHD
jgi:uncharacterized OsmC-like protein